MGEMLACLVVLEPGSFPEAWPGHQIPAKTPGPLTVSVRLDPDPRVGVAETPGLEAESGH